MTDGVPYSYIAIGNDELGEELQNFIVCPHCNEQHEVQCSSTNPANRGNLLTIQFYKCGDKTYLAGINRKSYLPK
jgi:hypothetical protein